MVYNIIMNKARLKTWFSHHHVFALFILATILIFILNFTVGNQANAPKPVTQQNNSSQPDDGTFLTIVGEFVCLPHKDTTGPVTQECASGLKSEDTYYALSDGTPDQSLISKGVTGTLVRVGGTFKARSDSNYKDIGILTITSLEPVETPPPTL